MFPALEKEGLGVVGPGAALQPPCGSENLAANIQGDVSFIL